MKKILLFHFFIISLLFYCQQDIKIEYKKENNDNVVFIKNNTSLRQKVSLTIKGSGFQDIKSPIIKYINTGETLAFVTIKPKTNQSYTFTTSYEYQEAPTPDEQKILMKQIDERLFSGKEDVMHGLFIFTKTDCPRSQKTLNYLVQIDIKFVYSSIDQDPEMHKLMWEKLKTIGVTKDITMPVIIYKGKISHSHSDLSKFLKTLN
ncbi:MAG: glutaredoxin domain-containing protein [Soonwooa sp.]